MPLQSHSGAVSLVCRSGCAYGNVERQRHVAVFHSRQACVGSVVVAIHSLDGITVAAIRQRSPLRVGEREFCLWGVGEFCPFSLVGAVGLGKAVNLIFRSSYLRQIGVGDSHAGGADHKRTVDVVFLDICENTRFVVVAEAVFLFGKRIFIGSLGDAKSGMSLGAYCKHISARSRQFVGELKRVPLIVDVGNILAAEQHG